MLIKEQEKYKCQKYEGWLFGIGVCKKQESCKKARKIWFSGDACCGGGGGYEKRCYGILTPKLPEKMKMGVKFLDKDDKEHRTETEWIKLKINEIIDHMGEKM